MVEIVLGASFLRSGTAPIFPKTCYFLLHHVSGYPDLIGYFQLRIAGEQEVKDFGFERHLGIFADSKAVYCLPWKPWQKLSG